MSNINNKKWEIISRKEVYDGSPYIKVCIDKIRLPNGKVIDDYHRIEVHKYLEGDFDETIWEKYLH